MRFNSIFKIASGVIRTGMTNSVSNFSAPTTFLYQKIKYPVTTLKFGPGFPGHVGFRLSKKEMDELELKGNGEGKGDLILHHTNSKGTGVEGDPLKFITRDGKELPNTIFESKEAFSYFDEGRITGEYYIGEFTGTMLKEMKEKLQQNDGHFSEHYSLKGLALNKNAPNCCDFVKDSLAIALKHLGVLPSDPLFKSLDKALNIEEVYKWQIETLKPDSKGEVSLRSKQPFDPFDPIDLALKYKGGI